MFILRYLSPSSPYRLLPSREGYNSSLHLLPLSMLQVVDIYDPTYRGRKDNPYTLYVTDYTSHLDLFSYPDGRNGSGPRGQQILSISLFEPHDAAYISNLKKHPRALLRLENVQVSENKGSEGDTLEGKLNTDRDRPKQINLSFIDVKSPGIFEKQVTAMNQYVVL